MNKSKIRILIASRDFSNKLHPESYSYIGTNRIKAKNNSYEREIIYE